ncbi:MAG: hypothetical protein AB7T32_08125 [Dehalococcoidia bacterium]
MAIENRNMEAGTRLAANYKKQRYVCVVDAEGEGEGVAYVLEDGTRHKSPSSAAMKVIGGKAVNGWRFWSLEGEAKPVVEDADKPDKAPRPSTGRKPKKLICRSPNQQRVAEGKTRWFCTA